MTFIRPVTFFDIDQIQQSLADSMIAETSNLPLPYPSDGAEKWFEKVSKGIFEGRQVVFVIISENQLVGVMSINNINLDKSSASLDYWVSRNDWGKGHATQAAKLALNYARNVLGLSIIDSGCLNRNFGSRRVLEKCGFKFVEELLYSGPFTNRFYGEFVSRYQIVLQC